MNARAVVICAPYIPRMIDDHPVIGFGPLLMIYVTANNRCMLRTRWSKETINDCVDPFE